MKYAIKNYKIDNKNSINLKKQKEQQNNNILINKKLAKRKLID